MWTDSCVPPAEWMLQMSIKDETVGPYTDGLRCLIFQACPLPLQNASCLVSCLPACFPMRSSQKNRADIPDVRMGDVVRFHRAMVCGRPGVRSRRARAGHPSGGFFVFVSWQKRFACS
jgi:hypothetical protein